MNRADTMAFIQKMIQAKRMEAEALLHLLPEKTRGHMKVIGKELGAMVMECLTEVFIKPEGSEADKMKQDTTQGVRKVDIG
ncbi:MAG: hypothetical protein KBA53_11615 [Thermoclostridium sp.]|nr:hypothetical protein [Thermoclostridium sp.]